MANMVVPTVSSAAADTSSSSTPAAALPANGGFSMTPAAALSIGASTQAGLSASPTLAMAPETLAQTGTVSAGGPAASVPLPSGGADETGLAMQPMAGWQPADVFGTGQFDIWGPGSNAAWSAALGAGSSFADYNVSSTDTFVSDSSMGDTLWYDPSAGNIDTSQIASAQSTTGTDFGDQSPSAGEGFVSGSGASPWPAG